MTPPVQVTDHAVLRYLERAHGLDVEAIRRHIAGQCATGAQLGAIGVVVEHVKFVLATRDGDTTVITALKATWPTRPGGGR
ncbi:hypothetical protein [Shinella pollutisoli]|uniref:Uncharacterized protein n=1 Tax=Shinella pollutisoli TaxID=2250594 RepID=A0ABV7DJ06_9HYPH|nr:hypothetical protein [Shinella pollutisoli]